MLFVFLDLKNGNPITPRHHSLDTEDPASAPQPTSPSARPRLVYSRLFRGLGPPSRETHQLLNGKHQRFKAPTPLSAASTKRDPCSLGDPGPSVKDPPSTKLPILSRPDLTLTPGPSRRGAPSPPTWEPVLDSES